MQIRSLAIRLVLVALVALSTSSCYMLDQLRALRVIKDAHTQYQRSDYVLAAELYEEVLENDPDLVEAYFYLANSYDQQFRPALRGEPENDEMLDRAIEILHHVGRAPDLPGAADAVAAVAGGGLRPGQGERPGLFRRSCCRR